TEFILEGLTDKPELQLPLFLLFLGFYVLTVVGNLGIILILLSSHLHTPMYFFLSSLSFIDLCYSTVITPKMLVNFVTEKNIISYPDSALLLPCFCYIRILLLDGWWGIWHGLYWCCIVLLCLSAFNIFIPTLVILSSYIFIIASILRIKSTEGRFKIFSMCSSHFFAVAVFFGPLAFMYLRPSSVTSKDQGKVSSVFYTTVVSMLNPLIYSMRNKDVKLVLNKILQRNFT
uniref:G-protein coupled receptors family 1 profile domain-containing protein n=1 Tax=Jaculus jaculus TaxID=51337 RepID=A0A8C5L906_JACJA